MILIIAEPGDGAALWLQRALAATTATPVRFVTPAQLVYARAATHLLSNEGGTIGFLLADGSRIDGAALRGCVNRFAILPQAHLMRASAEDRLYAAGELYAFTLGWLATLPCPLLNPPAPECLAGAWHGALAAQHFAVLAGFACAPIVLPLDAARDPADPLPPPPGTQRHVVLAGEVIGPPLPDAARDAMLQFAGLWGAAMIEIASLPRAGRRQFVGASAMVDFPHGGAPLVAALLRALTA